MIELTVDLGDRSYPIFIGKNLISSKELLEPFMQCKKAIVISDRNVAGLYFSQLEAVGKSLKVEMPLVAIDGGESSKSWQTLNQIYQRLIDENCDRETPVVALGGGVVGDVAGFAAATYQRGVPFIQVPTTLLAQVDSSVGGKTAINHAMAKNMIGAFHQPNLVLADVVTLTSLPKREISAGIAEIIKYGLISDKNFFSWLEENITELVGLNLDFALKAIKRSCELKASIVGRDEREKGVRAILNLGHTFGHAIEANGNYVVHLHGEAVAMGTVLAAEMSVAMKLISKNDARRIKRLLKAANLPIQPPNLGFEKYLQFMSRDKKVKNGKIKLILLSKIGEAVIRDDFDINTLKNILSLDWMHG